MARDPLTGATTAISNAGREVPNSGDPFNGICQSTKCPDGKYLFQNRGPQWGPRFGIAWDVTGKQNIVIRTGAGIYYDQPVANVVSPSISARSMPDNSVKSVFSRETISFLSLVAVAVAFVGVAVVVTTVFRHGGAPREEARE